MQSGARREAPRDIRPLVERLALLIEIVVDVVRGFHAFARVVQQFKARSPGLIVDQELQSRKIPIDEYADLGHGLRKYPKAGRYAYDLFVQQLSDGWVLSWPGWMLGYSP